MSSQFRNLDALGGRVSVPIPTGENGFLGRECPEENCLGYFKVKPGTGLTGPDLLCHCPYCGRAASPNSFWTKDQIEYAKSVVLRRYVGAIRKDLKQFEFNYPARGPFGIGLSMKVRSAPLPTLKHYSEQQLETDVVCDRCKLHYAVFGLFAYCPDCGVHNSLQVLQRNLALVGKQLGLAASVDSEELARQLVEDALENCVSAFDGFARETCRIRADRSTNPERCRDLSFQNLRRAALTLKDLFNIDLPGSVDAEAWGQTERAFLKRHLLAHCSGVVDEKYKKSSGDDAAIVGRQIAIDPTEVAAVAGTVEALGSTLLQRLPEP